MHLANCPACGRAVSMLRDGELCTHGPGPDGEFVCPGSGDSNMVHAAQHLHVEDIDETPHEHPLSNTHPTRTKRR
jgi:hypothetical protein